MSTKRRLNSYFGVNIAATALSAIATILIALGGIMFTWSTDAFWSLLWFGLTVLVVAQILSVITSYDLSRKHQKEFDALKSRVEALEKARQTEEVDDKESPSVLKNT